MDRRHAATKAAQRPQGIVIIAVLFAAFSALDTALLFLKGEVWWMVVLAMSALLMYLFRGLWWGDEPLRKVAVFLGFLFGALSLLLPPETPGQGWTLDEAVALAEGIFMVGLATYLMQIRTHPFFAEREDA